MGVERVGSAGVKLEPSWKARSAGPDLSEQFWAFKIAHSTGLVPPER